MSDIHFAKFDAIKTHERNINFIIEKSQMIFGDILERYNCMLDEIDSYINEEFRSRVYNGRCEADVERIEKLSRRFRSNHDRDRLDFLSFGDMSISESIRGIVSFFDEIGVPSGNIQSNIVEIVNRTRFELNKKADEICTCRNEDGIDSGAPVVSGVVFTFSPLTDSILAHVKLSDDRVPICMPDGLFASSTVSGYLTLTPNYRYEYDYKIISTVSDIENALVKKIVFEIDLNSLFIPLRTISDRLYVTKDAETNKLHAFESEKKYSNLVNALTLRMLGVYNRIYKSKESCFQKILSETVKAGIDYMQTVECADIILNAIGPRSAKIVGSDIQPLFTQYMIQGFYARLQTDHTLPDMANVEHDNTTNMITSSVCDAAMSIITRVNGTDIDLEDINSLTRSINDTILKESVICIKDTFCNEYPLRGKDRFSGVISQRKKIESFGLYSAIMFLATSYVARYVLDSIDKADMLSDKYANAIRSKDVKMLKNDMTASSTMYAYTFELISGLGPVYVTERCTNNHLFQTTMKDLSVSEYIRNNFSRFINMVQKNTIEKTLKLPPKNDKFLVTDMLSYKGDGGDVRQTDSDLEMSKSDPFRDKSFNHDPMFLKLNNFFRYYIV